MAQDWRLEVWDLRLWFQVWEFRIGDLRFEIWCLRFLSFVRLEIWELRCGGLKIWGLRFEVFWGVFKAFQAQNSLKTPPPLLPQRRFFGGFWGVLRLFWGVLRWFEAVLRWFEGVLSLKSPQNTSKQPQNTSKQPQNTSKPSPKWKEVIWNPPGP